MSRYNITLQASNGLRVTALRGNGSPRVSVGGGGWEEVPRPRRQALTIWRGRPPFRLQIPLLFEGFPDTSVEQAISTLERMALPAGGEPPTVRVVAGAVPHKDLVYVIEAIEFGDLVEWGTNDRVRQDCVVTLLQRVKEERLQTGATTHPRTGPVSVTVRKGDTLRKIAAREGVDIDELKKANPNIRDPNHLKVGSSVRIP